MYKTPGDAADDTELVVSELVSNCVRTDAHRFDLALDGHHDAVRVEATDDAPGQPASRAARHSDTTGRGLLIVSTLAKDWGVHPNTEGKTVWADLAVSATSSPTFDCDRSQ